MLSIAGMVDNARDILLGFKKDTSNSRLHGAGKVNFKRGGSSKSKRVGILSRMQGGTGTQQTKSASEKGTDSRQIKGGAVEEATVEKESSGTSDSEAKREGSPDSSNEEEEEESATSSDRWKDCLELMDFLERILYPRWL